MTFDSQNLSSKMELEEHRISALLPVKNAAPYLKSNLVRILDSISQADELVIVDDGSTDGSSEILSNYARLDSRILLIKGSGTGLVDALNLGIAETSNEWIARYDADDTYDINRIHLQRQRIQSRVVGIFSDYSVHSQSGTNLGHIESGVISQVVSVSLVSSQRTAHPSVLLNKTALLQSGAYRSSDFPAEDLSLWLRLAKVGDLISIPLNLLNYQLTPGSITSTKRKASLQKKAELLTEIPVSREAITFTLENWQDIFSRYDKWSSPVRRKILMLKDLRNIEAVYGLDMQQKKLLKEIQKNILFNPKSQYALMQMAKEKCMRAYVRRMIR